MIHGSSKPSANTDAIDLPSRQTSILAVFLKVFFSLLYHQFAWAYDLVAWIVSLGLWNQWVACALPHLPGSTILEIGHGPGHLQLELLALGKTSYAIDESWQMNRLAYRRILSRTLQPAIVNGYAQSIPFPDNSLEHIVATFPTEYIFQADTLAEISRVLRERGTLVLLPIAVFTGNTFPNRVLRFIHRITGQAPAKLDAEIITQLTRPLEKAGYSISSYQTPVSSSQVLVIVANPDREL